ncbi:unnamed protein product [Pieris macdunnoughi]|uniref:Uncharacterized protein n=1 Tax=Pieris macdunnoughi TaxID=345717 RepID=A0A821QTA9_9NEOP|nr:unnamed protein product [Pieris macdunnoughi]
MLKAVLCSHNSVGRIYLKTLMTHEQSAEEQQLRIIYELVLVSLKWRWIGHMVRCKLGKWSKRVVCGIQEMGPEDKGAQKNDDEMI